MKNNPPFKKIMVALDLSNMDEKLISYSRFIAKNATTKSLRFVHVIPQFFLPESISSSFEELIGGKEPIERQVRRKLAKELQPTEAGENGLNIEVDILEGNPLECLLKEARQYKPDLLIVGKKILSDNSGVIAHRIARKVDCPVFFVTKKSNIKIKRIIVPVDFSDTSARAWQAAIQLQKQLAEPQITALHIIDVPMTAYKTNRNQTDIVSQLKQAALENFGAFLKKHKFSEEGIQLATVINDEFNVSTYIRKTAAQQKADLIIMGAKGHSMFEDFVFGSTTEKLVSSEMDVPILIIR